MVSVERVNDALKNWAIADAVRVGIFILDVMEVFMSFSLLEVRTMRLIVSWYLFRPCAYHVERCG